MSAEVPSDFEVRVMPRPPHRLPHLVQQGKEEQTEVGLRDMRRMSREYAMRRAGKAFEELERRDLDDHPSRSGTLVPVVGSVWQGKGDGPRFIVVLIANEPMARKHPEEVSVVYVTEKGGCSPGTTDFWCDPLSVFIESMIYIPKPGIPAGGLRNAQA
jgi:hypothetical protein